MAEGVDWESVEDKIREVEEGSEGKSTEWFIQKQLAIFKEIVSTQKVTTVVSVNPATHQGSGEGGTS